LVCYILESAKLQLPHIEASCKDSLSRGETSQADEPCEDRVVRTKGILAVARMSKVGWLSVVVKIVEFSKHLKKIKVREIRFVY